MKIPKCDTCNSLNCRHGADCYGVADMCKETYKDVSINKVARNASLLIDNGRAGTLNRLEEIIEFCKLQNYKTIGLAYCLAFKDVTMEIVSILKKEGFITAPVICTAGGVKENDIDTLKTNDTVSCNPIGQSAIITKSKADFVIEYGLCLGHDILFHSKLEIPFTVFFVKDRKHDHNPIKALASFTDSNKSFIDNLDNSFAMKPAQWLKDQIDGNIPIAIIDLRNNNAFENSNIPGSINIPLKSLPAMLHILPKNKHQHILCYCNGSVQSAYAIMFLYSRGFINVHNLSGGYGSWQKLENN